MLGPSATEPESHWAKFEIIYQEYRNLMFYVANRILRNDQDAEDIVQQSFLKIIEVLDKIPSPKCPQTKGLVVTITERKAIDLYRTRRRKAVEPLEEQTERAPACDPEAMVDSLQIAQAIAALPARYREVLLLRYDNGYTVPEIARLLSMTQAGVKKTIQRARGRLERILTEQEVQPQ